MSTSLTESELDALARKVLERLHADLDDEDSDPLPLEHEPLKSLTECESEREAGGVVMVSELTQNAPMTLADYLLSHLAQECAEVIVRATKAQHFGLDEVQPEQQHTNAERVMHEWCDLIATMETLQEYGMLPELSREEYVRRKKDKRAKAALFREYSRNIERLTGA